MIIKLAQNSRELPQPKPGQRIILDEKGQEQLEQSQQPAPLISHSLLYGLGAVVLLVIAVLAIISFIAGNKKKHREQLLQNKNPYPKFVSTPSGTTPAATSNTDQKK